MTAKRIFGGVLITIISLVGLAVVALVGWNLVRTAVEPASALAKASTEKPAKAKPAAAQSGEPAKPTLVAQEAAKPATSTTTTTTTTHGGWTVVCNEGGDPPSKICSANFRVVNKENKANILVWAIGRNAEGKLLSEFFTLTEILVQPGVGVTLGDNKAVKADFVSCGAQGCKASMELTEDLIGQMKETTKARIDLTRIDGQVIQFSMEIPGVDLVLADLGA